MLITSVERNKRNRDFLLIYIDGLFAFSIPEDEYVILHMYEKKDITEEEIYRIKTNILFRTAKSLAIKFLSLKIRTEKEVRNKLELEGFDGEIIENAISYILSLGYINDKLYAQKFLYDRSKLKPKSKKLLKYELIHKGVEERVIEEILENWEMDEESVVENLLRKKFGKYDLTNEKIIRKAYSFLMHRGFDYELIRRVLGKISKFE